MEHFWIVFILALICAAGGTGLMACSLSTLPRKANKIMIFVCLGIVVVGIAGFISMSSAIKKTEISKSEEMVYEISKVTTNSFIFENDNGTDTSMSLAEYYVTVNEATGEYSNVVVKSTTLKKVNWIIDFETEDSTFAVYLDSDVYNRYKNPNTLYERAEINEN